ncbi:glycoside hydrolase [Maribacter sp.]|nr:glycoside hydrolase [Maribacter sp.]
MHQKGIRVHLKPHLWMNDGWRSNITLDSPSEWDAWFDSYRTNILRYARIAEETKAELFCMGTELKTSIKTQPERWESLIDEIRQIYSGELTYAANWYDEYEHVTFWNKLDYIGIQAYFPLTKEKYPSLKSIEKGWEKPLIALKAVHEKYKKPILFTEVGYKSEADATIKPWEWSPILSNLTKKKSDQTQQLAYEALLRQTWDQPWFAGVYIWQWDTRTTKESAETDLDFSPRFKPAENVMAKWFGKK